VAALHPQPGVTVIAIARSVSTPRSRFDEEEDPWERDLDDTDPFDDEAEEWDEDLDDEDDEDEDLEDLETFEEDEEEDEF
jgi:hypothetical protein